jgi:tetratricopeptide (TPR) repeat protein
MARIVLTTVVIVLLNVLVGCQGVDSGRGQLMPSRTRTLIGSSSVVNIAKAGETDFVEQIVVNRQEYRQGLERLIRYYTRTGNNMKFKWAKEELAALDSIPQYKYIVEAEVAGANLRANTSIPEADELYQDALELQQKATVLIVAKDNELLRLALEKYNRLIRQYPSSDKIDDAACKAGEIYEYFQDYSIALLYYKRSYQWDPDTTQPARFRSARILDKRLHRNAEALELYREAINTEGRYGQLRMWKEYAEKRIKALYKTEGDNN